MTDEQAIKLLNDEANWLRASARVLKQHWRSQRRKWGTDQWVTKTVARDLARLLAKRVTQLPKPAFTD